MKKIAFFIFAVIAMVIADDDINLEEVAKMYDTDVVSIQACLEEVETNLAEIHALLQKAFEMKDDNTNEEIKQTLTKYSLFLACTLEKNGMMVDTKFVVDKLLESIEKDKDSPKIQDKEVLTECINSVNENEMTREDRVFGLILCLINSQPDGERK